MPSVKFHGISVGKTNNPYHIRQLKDAVQTIRSTKTIFRLGCKDLDTQDIPGTYSIRERKQFIANIVHILISMSRTLVNKPGVQHRLLLNFYHVMTPVIVILLRDVYIMTA